MSLICWVVTDGKVGMENQCIAIARRLGLTPVIKRVKMRAPWKQLSPWGLRIGNRWSLSPEGDQLDGPLPDILIATGRHSVTSSLAIRDMTQGHCLRIQIQNPGIDPGNFDLVVVPRHDRLSGPNVLVTRGAPHGVTPEALAAAREKFAPRFAHLPNPRITLLLGGNNGVYRLNQLAADKLADCLSTLARGTQGSVLVTPSRRTGAAIEAAFRKKLAGVAGEIWDGTGDNPYLGYLAYADHIVVTADSVNMVCEAASTGKPVHVVPLDGGSDKFRRFHDGLVEDGITRPFHGQLDRWTYETFDDTQRVAARITEMMAHH